MKISRSYLATRSYLTTGFWVAFFTALLFIHFGASVLPLLGLTCGLVKRSVWRCLAGLMLSAGGALFLVIGITRRYTPLSPPDGLFHEGGTTFYAYALYGACIGAVLLLPQGRLVFLALLGCCLGTINLLIVSGYFRHHFPGDATWLSFALWEYATVLAAVPIMSFWLWGPVTLLRHKQVKASAEMFGLLHSLKKSMDLALFQSKSHPLMLERAVGVAVKEAEYDQLVMALHQSRFLLPRNLRYHLFRFLDIVFDASVEPLATDTEEDAARKHELVASDLNAHYNRVLQTLPWEVHISGTRD